MKKYLAAAVVAVMVFAFAAFAASLDVTAPTLQVGQTAEGELECTENADITAWYYNDHIDPGTVSGATIVLDDDHTCAGDRLYLSVLDADGDTIATESKVLGADRTIQIGLPNNSFLVDADQSGAIPAADVYGARIAIDQGW